MNSERLNHGSKPIPAVVQALRWRVSLVLNPPYGATVV